MAHGRDHLFLFGISLEMTTLLEVVVEVPHLFKVQRIEVSIEVFLRLVQNPVDEHRAELKLCVCIFFSLKFRNSMNLVFQIKTFLLWI